MKAGVAMARRSFYRDGHVVTVTDEAATAVTRAVANVCQLQAVTMIVDTATTTLDESWRYCELKVDGETVTVQVEEILGQGALFLQCIEDANENLSYRYFAGRYEDSVWSFSSVITTGRGTIADHSKAVIAAVRFILDPNR